MNNTWYQTLIQPPLTPPGWIFAPVWTVLYLMMLASLILYARKCTKIEKAFGYFIFFIQIVINFTWSSVFFGLKNIGFALIFIILLDILVLINIIEFSHVSKKAGFLLVPYFIWILFATYLNISLFILN